MGLSQTGGRGLVVGAMVVGEKRSLVCLGEASSMSKSLNYIKVDLRFEKLCRGGSCQKYLFLHPQICFALDCFKLR